MGTKSLLAESGSKSGSGMGRWVKCSLCRAPFKHEDLDKGKLPEHNSVGNDRKCENSGTENHDPS